MELTILSRSQIAKLHDAALSLLLSPGVRILLHIRGAERRVVARPGGQGGARGILRALLRHWTIAVKPGAALAGTFVNRILDLQSVERSGRWALLFSIGFVWLMISVASMVFVHEEPAPQVSDKPDVRESLRKVWLYLREDRWLRRVILVQLVISTPAATFAFFVVRARQIIPDAATMIGTFVILQSIGSAAAALVGGVLIDRGRKLGGDPCRRRSRSPGAGGGDSGGQ